MRRLFYLLPLVLLVFTGIGFATRRLSIPREYNPFAALHVADPVTPMTRFKLRKLRRDPDYCAAALTTSQLGTTILPSAGTADCPLDNAVRVNTASVRLSSSFLASCPLAVAYAMWERHALLPLAQQQFNAGVSRVQHLGSYACRNVRGGTRQSEHATANAIDISALTLSDGRGISVEQDWKTDSAESRFLRALHKQSCRFFTMTLGPDYDAAHHNHFHLGMGGRFGLCR